MSRRGTVVKAVGGTFTVTDDRGEKYVCFSPKKFRYKSEDVVIGDNVEFDCLKNGKGVITGILPRKNKLCRPEIANVDVCFLVLADEPAPDWYLADKILINCFQEKIEPIIVVNKSDLSLGTFEEAQKNYGTVAEVISMSALDESPKLLEKYLGGKTACFAGQSAVGKTSLLNVVLPHAHGIVGELSEKTSRGMHTTRHAVLYPVMGGFIADTCGFSLFDLKGIRSEELRLYWDDFVSLSCGCRFTSCTHTVEPDCAVKEAVQNGVLYGERYKRYLEEYAELKEYEKSQY